MTEYLTPYYSTIFYNQSNIFETAVAKYAYRVQIFTSHDLTNLEFISPIVFIFGQDFDQHFIDNLLSRGFQTIYVFATEREYNNVTYCTKDDIFTVLNITGYLPCYVIELLASALFNKPCQSIENSVEQGKYLLAELSVDDLDKINNLKGFSVLEDLISNGKVKTQLYKEYMKTAWNYNEFVVVYGTMFLPYIKRDYTNYIVWEFRDGEFVTSCSDPNLQINFLDLIKR